MLRFAILKTVGEKAEVVLEYFEKQILRRLQARVREYLAEKEIAEDDPVLMRLQVRVKENLTDKENIVKHKFTKEEVIIALIKAYRDLAIEFFTKKEAATALDKSFNDLVIEFKEKTITLK